MQKGSPLATAILSPSRRRTAAAQLPSPCISTGVYGYPLEAAAKIAIREVNAFLENHPEIEETFCCFSKRDAEVYEKLIIARGH